MTTFFTLKMHAPWCRSLMQQLLVLALALCTLRSSADDGQYHVGVYYFPGWRQSDVLVTSPPWESIKPYPERKPLLGWYQGGDQAVADQHLKWMIQYGIDFVIYDWYWVAGHGAALTADIDAFLKAPQRDQIKFSILWANHTQTPSSDDDFKKMVQFWIEQYFSSPSFYRVNGRPVVFVFSPGELRRIASNFHSTAGTLISEAQALARAAGYPGIYFVGSTEAYPDQLDALVADGYDAASAYNYHAASIMAGGSEHASHTYSELTDAYIKNWKWIVQHSSIPYFVPVTSGWNKRPLGGTAGDMLHDNSQSTAASFRKQLVDARTFMESHPDKTLRTAVICCWNEFGEGSYIEPARSTGFSYLDVVKNSLK